MKARKKGISRAVVSDLFKCDPSTVSRIVSKAKTTGLMHRREKKGRPRRTTAKEDRILVMASKKDPNMTSTEGARLIKDVANKDISRWTVSRRLTQAGLYSRRAVRKPLMTAGHRKQRLLFARTYQSWTKQDWANVIFPLSSSGIFSCFAIYFFCFTLNFKFVFVNKVYIYYSN